MECLVYVDPSPRGEWALSLAALLPLQRVSLCLLATSEDLAEDGSLLSRARERLAAAASLREMAVPGPAERAVVWEARARHYDLVLVPPAGRNVLQRLIRGSRVATVVRSVPAPGLVARRPPPRVERVLGALSGGPLTAAVCRATCDWAAAFGAQAAFVHVVSEVVLPFEPHGAAEAAPRPAAPDPAEAARAALRSLGRGESLIVREGLVVDEVIDEFEQGAHHVLVTGARASSEPRHWTREDLTERILLRCPGSMLVVHAAP
jgi:nucleotide-binding universal stress UspA family protein